MKALGANNALNLDGGSSTAMYARGRFVSKPGRMLTNVLVVTVRPGAPVPEEVEIEAAQAEDEWTQPAPETDGEPAPEPDQVDLETQDI